MTSLRLGENYSPRMEHYLTFNWLACMRRLVFLVVISLPQQSYQWPAIIPQY